MTARLLLRLADGPVRELPVAPADTQHDLATLLTQAGLPLNTRCAGHGWCRGCTVTLGTERVRACKTRFAAVGDSVVGIPNPAHLSAAPSVGATFDIDTPFTLAPPFPIVPGHSDTAFAVDIGTTTVAVLLVDLLDGRILSRAGAFNAQLRFGDNVLTRIGACHDPARLRDLRAALVDDTLPTLLAKAAARAERPLSRLCGGSIAANTTMLHLLLGIDPTPMGAAPYTPAFLESRTLSATALGLHGCPPAIPIQLLPGFSAFVGADLAAGVHATGLCFDEKPSLLVDIGTNGEMVLHHEGRLLGCATAAGPAFEGSGLLSGTRAHSGAVCALRIQSSTTVTPGTPPQALFSLETIGTTPPSSASGLCGTAYIDFLAEGRRAGLLTPSGRFSRAFLDTLPPDCLARTPHGIALSLSALLAPASEPAPSLGSPSPNTAHGAPSALLIGEQDLASLLQAKAAIAAGLGLLLDEAGLQPRDIGRLYLAGGFGMHLNLANALAIGLLPGFSADQLRVVGNTSLAGALLACLDSSALPAMEASRSLMHIVGLSSHQDFENRFIDALELP